jgi:superfamily II DNA or RNA helicase
MVLHPYQQAAAAAVMDGWDKARRQLVVLPTGGGKTILFSHLAAREGGRTLILAHREELIEQAADKLAASTGLRAEIEKAERKATQQARIVVGSIQTLARRFQRWDPQHFSLVVCDEAHHAISTTWQTVLQHFSGARVLGVTATPDRGDQRELGGYFEKLAYEVSLIDLIRGGYLSPISIKAVPLQIDLRGVQQRAGDFDAGQLGHALEPYLGAIAASLREHARGRRILAFLPLIATSQKFIEHARAAGFRAEHVDGVDPERAPKLERFAGWETEVLSNAMLLTEGFDDPGIDCVLVLRPTKSRPLYAQMVGRGTRLDPPLKENLLLLDFLWLHEKHSIVRPAHLVAKTEEEAQAITLIAQDTPGGGEQDLLEAAGSAAAECESKLAQELAKNRKRGTKLISAAEFALQNHDLGLAEYEPTLPWEKKGVTPKQAGVISRAHIDPKSVNGRGHASKIIDRIFANQRLELASESQQRRLRIWGHENPESASVTEYGRWAAERFRRQR